jgi:hypothetical protein
LAELKVLTEVSVVTAGADVVACDLVGASALLNMRSSVYYTLNPVGSRIWRLIQEPKSVSAICDDVVATYEVDRQRCCDDVLVLLRNLSNAGLIEIVG